MSANKIVVIDQGQVVEQGNLKTLLAKDAGLFSKLYRQQFSKAV